MRLENGTPMLAATLACTGECVDVTSSADPIGFEVNTESP